MPRALFLREASEWKPRGLFSGLLGNKFSFFGPEAGGYLTGMMFADNGTAYTRADVGGAYRKDPGSTLWVQLIKISGIANPRFDDAYVDAIACCPADSKKVYAAVGHAYSPEGRFLASSDSGTTWVTSNKTFQIDGNGEYRYGREPIAVQHDNANIVYYGTRREGLWRSTNGGVDFTKITTLPAAADQSSYHRLDVTFVHIIRNSPRVNGLAQGLWVSVQGKGIYRSDDAGATWTLVHAFATTAYVRDAQVASNGNLYAAIQNPTSFVRITPAGVVTTLANPIGGEAPGVMTVHPTDPLTVWCGSDGIRDQKLFRSTNGGTSWETLNVSITNGTDGAVWPTTSDLEG